MDETRQMITYSNVNILHSSKKNEHLPRSFDIRQAEAIHQLIRASSESSPIVYVPV